MVTAGALEMVDREFSSIADAADSYAEELVTGSNKADSDGLSEIALVELMSDFLKKSNLAERAEIRNNSANTDDIIRELEVFNVRSVRDLKRFISSPNVSDRLVELGRRQKTAYFLPGFYRSAMIIADPEKFFGEAVTSHADFSKYTYRRSFLEDISSVTNNCDLEKICQKAGINVNFAE